MLRSNAAAVVSCARCALVRSSVDWCSSAPSVQQHLCHHKSLPRRAAGGTTGTRNASTNYTPPQNKPKTNEHENYNKHTTSPTQKQNSNLNSQNLNTNAQRSLTCFLNIKASNAKRLKTKNIVPLVQKWVPPYDILFCEPKATDS